MTQVNDYQNRTRYAEGRPNQVLKMVDVKMKAAQFTTNEGKVEVMLALFFGMNVKTNKPNVIVMNPDEIKSNFKEAAPFIYDGLVKLFEQQEKEAPALPEGVPDAMPLEKAS